MGYWGWLGAEKRVLQWAAALSTTLTAGQDVAPPGTMQVRYNDVAKVAEISIDGSDYAVLADSSGTVGPWTEYTGGVVGLTDLANTVSIGDDVMFSTERLRVVGDARVEGTTTLTNPGVPALVIGTAGFDGNWARLLTKSTVNAGQSYNWNNAEFPNAAAPHNQVANLGWNCDPFGNRIVAGEPVLRDSWESNFDTGAARLMERHWQYVDGNGANARRGLSMSINRADHTVDLVINGDFQVFDSTGVQQRLILSDGTGANVNIIFNSCIPHYNVSQQPFPNFLNQAGNNYIPGLVRGASDEIFVGGVNGTGVRLRAGATVLVDVDATGMQIASGATGPTAGSCLLEVTSTTQGVRFPNMTTTQRDNIVGPVAGLVVFNTTTGVLNFHNGAAWGAV
jgi:hypothetical protein